MDERREGECGDDADHRAGGDQTQRSPDDEAGDHRPRTTERQTNPDLAHTLGNEIRHDGKEADSRDRERQHA